LVKQPYLAYIDRTCSGLIQIVARASNMLPRQTAVLLNSERTTEEVGTNKEVIFKLALRGREPRKLLGFYLLNGETIRKILRLYKDLAGARSFKG
jgi:hypothetical protein